MLPHPAFCSGAGDGNSGPRVCTVNPLEEESFPRPQTLGFSFANYVVCYFPTNSRVDIIAPVEQVKKLRVHT